jgi:hypothetical protein
MLHILGQAMPQGASEQKQVQTLLTLLGPRLIPSPCSSFEAFLIACHMYASHVLAHRSTATNPSTTTTTAIATTAATTATATTAATTATAIDQSSRGVAEFCRSSNISIVQQHHLSLCV